MAKYFPIHKPNQVLCGTGHTAIVTGWTVKQAIAKHLAPEEYAAIGQLYSPTRGINFLIRNLFWNPHVRFLVVLNATKEDRNAGGSECLLDFFRNGFALGKSDTGKECWVINSSFTGYIDLEISADALEMLRRSIVCQEAKTIEEAIEQVKSFASCTNSRKLSQTPANFPNLPQTSPNFLPDPLEAAHCPDPWGEPLTFPLVESPPTVMPGPRYGHRIEGKTIAETWVKIIHRIKTTGTIRPTGYDGQWQELIDLMAVVTDEPPGFYFPTPNYLPVDEAFIREYIPQVLDDAPYREGVKYTYGQRLRSWFGRDQIEQVIGKLIKEIDAASAVMSLWDVKDHDRGGSPCLNHIWLRVVDNELSLTAIFRSNDMFSAWVANAMGLRALQQHIRDEIAQRSDYDLRMGPLITLSQSAHIYDDTWENADRLIENHYKAICNDRGYNDPCGNFVIEVNAGEIVVLQTTPGSGEEVKRYRGKNPLVLIREICCDSPTIQPDHIGYLGMELQKARDCIKNDRCYTQDQGA